MNTEFKVKLTAKDDRAVYSQNLPMPIHLKVYLIVHNFAAAHVCAHTYAQTWDHHSPTILKTRKSHFCSEETEWEIRSSCGSRENQ